MANETEVEGPSILDRFRGCLMGGGVGDALGAAVEFMSWEQIQEQYGKTGIQEYGKAYDIQAPITDDTQMTIATAVGILAGEDQNAGAIRVRIWNAYRDWYMGQNDPAQRRAPGNTCLSALAGNVRGRIGKAVNDSKGCGGVMRVAPIGLISPDPFKQGAAVAAMTHGHPSGYLSAGFLAAVIDCLTEGLELEEAISLAMVKLMEYPGHAETLEAVSGACAAASGESWRGVHELDLGEGWTGEEALGISLYCALTAEDFLDGIWKAVNHSGDSDSTGAITGNILGTLWGINEIPPEWLAFEESAAVQLHALAFSLAEWAGYVERS